MRTNRTGRRWANVLLSAGVVSTFVAAALATAPQAWAASGPEPQQTPLLESVPVLDAPSMLEERPTPTQAPAIVGGSASTRVAACPGAPIPAGYGIAGSRPYSMHTPTGTRYNPQGIVLFMLDTWENPAASKSQRLCLITWAARALNAGSYTKTFTDGDGHKRVARLYPYPYSFSANPSLPPLKSGWISGLAQGSVLTAMSYLHDDTDDDTYLDIAKQTFNSFLLPYASGGFVTERQGMIYLQEYVTSVPAYVLNGHNEALGALVFWAKRTGDHDALELARKALVAVHTTAPLEEVTFPTGLASSYDLLRGWSAAPLRAAPATPLTIHGATITGPGGTTHGSARIAVQRASGPAPNRLVNAGFSRWSGGSPTGWTVEGAGRYGSVVRGSDPRSVRIRSNGRGHVVVRQDLRPVARATQLSVSWKARLARRTGVDASPGDVVLQAVCRGSVKGVVAADVRSPIRATESIAGTIPAGCTPRVKLYQADGSAPSDVTFADVVARAVDPVGRALAPKYPISVLDVPTVSITVTYTGSGWLQGWVGGRWTTIGWLGAGRRRTVTVAVPTYMQGRTVNLRYHNSHIAEMTALYEMTGDTLLRDRALSWLPYAPAMEHMRPRLNAKVAPNPRYQDLYSVSPS